MVICAGPGVQGHPLKPGLSDSCVWAQMVGHVQISHGSRVEMGETLPGNSVLAAGQLESVGGSDRGPHSRKVSIGVKILTKKSNIRETKVRCRPFSILHLGA